MPGPPRTSRQRGVVRVLDVPCRDPVLGWLGRAVIVLAVRASFSTPLDPEDIFELGERLGVLLTSAYLLVRDAEVSHTAPDQGLSAIMGVVLTASPPLGAAIRQLPHDAAAALADEAADNLGGAEHAYRKAISGLEHEQHARRDIRRRALYRRGEHMTAAMLRIAHRTWYAIRKTS